MLVGFWEYGENLSSERSRCLVSGGTAPRVDKAYPSAILDCTSRETTILKVILSLCGAYNRELRGGF